MFNHLTVLFWLGSFKQFILRRCILKSVSLIHSTLIHPTFLRHSSDKIFNLFPFIFFHSFRSTHPVTLMLIDHVTFTQPSTRSRGTDNRAITDSAKSKAVFYVLKVHIELLERETIRNLCFTSARNNANWQVRHHVK